MSDALRAWTAEPVPPEAREAHFRRVRTYDDEMRRFGRSARRAGWIVGGIGTVLGLAGLGAALSLLPLKSVEIRWIAVDQSTGWVGDPITSKEAPKLFSQQTREQYLRRVVEQCESYSADTADLLWHHCVVFLSPEAQDTYAARMGPKNALAPRATLGRNGSIRVEDQGFRYDEMPPVKPGVFGYNVRFLRTEVVKGVPDRPTPWVTTVYFEWHPDWKMTPQDRSLNAAGFYALSYRAEPENPK